MRLYRKRFAVLTVLSFLLPSTISLAQIADDKKSVIVFDIQLAKLRGGTLYQKVGGDVLLQRMQGRNEEVELAKVDRVIGSFGYPKSVQEVQAVGNGADLPMEFFVRGRFSDDASAKAVYENFEQRSNVDNVDGKTYLRPPGTRDPTNVSISRPTANSIEMGTDGYVIGQKTRNFRTSRLTDAWDQLPVYPIRVAVDAETAEAIINEGIEMLGQRVPPQAAVMLAAAKDVSTIGIAIDVQADPMIAVRITGKSEQATTTLANTLNGLLMMAKGIGQQASGNLPPDMKTGANELLTALTAKQNGTAITLDIPRPEGFDELVAQAAEAAKASAKAVEDMNEMRMLGLAMHNYYSVYRKLPWEPHHESQNSELSWRVRVLPFLEEQPMYEMMDIGKAHHEAPNSQFANRMPSVLGNDEKRLMVYAIGHEVMPKGLKDIKDGSANTIAMIYAPATEGWLQPKHISIDDAIKVIRSAPANDPAIVCMYDGATIKMDPSTEEGKLRAMMTYDGGEEVDR